MRVRVLVSTLLVLGALTAVETAGAASLRVGPTAQEQRAQSPAALRRAERLRQRLARRNAVEERRAARLRERSPSRTAYSSLADRVRELVNEARGGEGLQPLADNSFLQRAAQAYAEDMATRGFFAHEDPEGRSSYDRILAGGYAKPSCDCSWRFGTGENLAKGQDTPEEAVEDWLASPGHRANILRADFEDTGVGYFDAHWVQLFGVSKVLP